MSVLVLVLLWKNFNPRPRKEGDCSFNKRHNRGLYFNPRPRKEGDYLSRQLGLFGFISIHALVKRATLDKTGYLTGEVISIHALVKRATVAALNKSAYNRHFNPRPREEGDGCDTAINEITEISIHALVKRATLKHIISHVASEFQSTPS